MSVVLAVLQPARTARPQLASYAAGDVGQVRAAEVGVAQIAEVGVEAEVLWLLRATRTRFSEQARQEP